MGCGIHTKQSAIKYFMASPLYFVEKELKEKREGRRKKNERER